MFWTTKSIIGVETTYMDPDADLPVVMRNRYPNNSHHGIDFENRSQWQYITWIIAWNQVCRDWEEMHRESGAESSRITGKIIEVKDAMTKET